MEKNPLPQDDARMDAEGLTRGRDKGVPLRFRKIGVQRETPLGDGAIENQSSVQADVELGGDGLEGSGMLAY